MLRIMIMMTGISISLCYGIQSLTALLFILYRKMNNTWFIRVANHSFFLYVILWNPIMKFKILTVGHPGNPHIQALADDYQKRIRRYASLSLNAVKPVRIKSLSDAQIKEQESEKLQAGLTGHGPVMALHAGGELLSSEEWAEMFNQYARQSSRQITFVIGGALGLTPEFLKKASRCLSLSPMTLPHELTLVVLLEQIYRVQTILKGEPYHK